MKLLPNKKQLVIDLIMIVIGTFVMGFGFSLFLEPNNISTGGFSGLSMIINELLNKIGVTFLTTSIIYFVLNVGLFLYALKALGRKFAIKALVGIASFSGAMEIFKLIPLDITYEPIVSAIYGGALMGLGIGLVVRFGGSTGGSDMIASIVKSKTPKASIGSIAIIVDMSVIALSLIVFSNGFELLPYTIIALILCSFLTDFVNEGYKQIRAYHIITQKPDEIADKIMRKLGRGCTLVGAKGMHTNIDKSILICLISKYQSNLLRRIIKDVDENAFVYSSPVSEVIGTWFKDSDIEKATSEAKKESKPAENTQTEQPLNETSELKPAKSSNKKAKNWKIKKQVKGVALRDLN